MKGLFCLSATILALSPLVLSAEADEKPVTLTALLDSLSSANVDVRLSAQRKLDSFFDELDATRLKQSLIIANSTNDPEILGQIHAALEDAYLSHNFVQELGFLGIEIGRDSLKQGNRLLELVRANDVVAGGPAAEAGVKAGDLILAINGETIEGKDCESRMRNAIATMGAGNTCRFKIHRFIDDKKAEELLIEVTLAPRKQFVPRGRDFLRPLTRKEQKESFNRWLERQKQTLNKQGPLKFQPSLDSGEAPMIQTRNPFIR